MQFRNLGCARPTVVTAPRERLPKALQGLPRDTDLMVTFATGSVSTMAINWVKAVQKTGVEQVLVGALDQVRPTACTIV